MHFAFIILIFIIFTDLLFDNELFIMKWFFDDINLNLSNNPSLSNHVNWIILYIIIMLWIRDQPFYINPSHSNHERYNIMIIILHNMRSPILLEIMNELEIFYYEIIIWWWNHILYYYVYSLLWNHHLMMNVLVINIYYFHSTMK